MHQVQSELPHQGHEIGQMATDADHRRADHHRTMQRRQRNHGCPRLVIGGVDALEHTPMFGLDQQQ